MINKHFLIGFRDRLEPLRKNHAYSTKELGEIWGVVGNYSYKVKDFFVEIGLLVPVYKIGARQRAVYYALSELGLKTRSIVMEMKL